MQIISTDLQGRAAKARDELSIFQSRLQLDPESSELASLSNELIQSYASLAANEESIIRQKAIINWLALGDNNMSLFQYIYVRKYRNKISSLYINKVKVNNPDAIKAEVVRYYQDVLGADPIGCYPHDVARGLSFFSQLTNSQKLELEREVTS
ncbi:hypothetical protein SUGI_1480290 [Cryptomeria japonica]|uniref:Uncharacterized protein n=1 Tax=Cryptomeria japonica TaxID=3369 RepID=A0AAD3NV77_CRYJA|nr:hypothetical protein SUGI_1478270 [Cryptomeria japonica]GLJ58844.1 hypothetical protein SUGI_1480290 [Cryptomeria japonica]